MKSVLTYVRSLIGWGDESFHTSAFKRDRVEQDLSSEDDVPALKRPKQLKRSTFPDIMTSNDEWDNKCKTHSKVRYVPIQMENAYPSTSTPLEPNSRLHSRVNRDNLKVFDVNERVRTTPTQRPRMHTPLRPMIHTVVDDPDSEPEVSWIAPQRIEHKSKSKTSPKLYIDLEDEHDKDTDEDESDDDIIFVKKVNSPRPSTSTNSYKFFVTKNKRNEIVLKKDSPKPLYRLHRKPGESEGERHSRSPKTYSKFKTPVGITKSYKNKAPTPIPKWLNPLQTTIGQTSLRDRLLNLNGNARSAISEVFNLDEKKSYQELIKRVSKASNLNAYLKPTEVIDIAQESAAFRSTQKAQKKSLDKIRIVEQGLSEEKAHGFAKEYDPLTVASLNSSDSEVELVAGSETSTSSSVRIVPINTFRDSLRDRAIAGEDWLTDIDKKYQKKRKETQEKLRDARRESDIITKLNYEHTLTQLERKLKSELSLPESLIEEEPEAVELPQLTQQQEKLIDRALGPGPSGQLLVEKFNLRIHRRDLHTLAGLNWLNDEVINFYMNLLMQRSKERNDLPKVYATNTFFYPKLMQSGHDGLRRWTKKVDIFAQDLLVVPVHLGVHWCLSLVDFGQRRINYLDSMGGRNQGALDALLQYLRDEHQDKKGQPFDDSGWRKECLKDIPQQMNGSDCGMFACTFAEFSCRRAPYSFSQTHMPYLRRKAALEILQGKLLM